MSNGSSQLPSIVSPENQGVTFVELFFDLVFVFSVTQVAELLSHHLSWGGVGQREHVCRGRGPGKLGPKVVGVGARLPAPAAYPAVAGPPWLPRFHYLLGLGCEFSSERSAAAGSWTSSLSAEHRPRAAESPSGTQAVLVSPLTSGPVSAVGAGVGALIGMLTRTDQWEPIQLDRLHVRISPTSGGMVLAFSARF